MRGSITIVVSLFLPSYHMEQTSRPRIFRVSAARVMISRTRRQGQITYRIPSGDLAMKRFYFHVRTTEGLEADYDGIAFAGIEAAQADAKTSLFEMMADDLAAGRQTKYLGINITDSLGTILAVVDATAAIERLPKGS